MQRHGPLRAACIAALWIVVITARVVVADPLLDALATEDPAALEVAVRAIEQAPTSPELADALFAAGRACEDRLLDPARALRIYERIERDLPYARVATSAQRRASRLRGIVGTDGEYAKRAAELAQLIAGADTLPLGDVIARATRLADAPWAGAAETALWIAEFLRRVKRYEQAQARYALVLERWPDTPQAAAAQLGAAGNALDAGAWELAARLAAALPEVNLADRTVKEDVLAAVARGRLLARLYSAAWIVIVLVFAGLLGSLADAAWRGGWRAPALRPPLEVWFLAPLGALLVAYVYVARPTIAPAVTAIAVGGLAMAWISGMTLDALRARGRALRLRAVAHVVACGVAVVAIGYVAITRGELIDLLVETVRSGPEG